MKSFWVSIMCSVVFTGALSVVSAQEAESDPESVVKVLTKETSAIARKANDYRVLGMNALKNADAARGETHKKLLEALLSGDADKIDAARDDLCNATDELEDVIKDVKRIIECSVKVEMLAEKAEALCKTAAASRGGEETKSVKEVKSYLSAAGKDLARAEKIARELRRDWLEPFFASTSTTSSTTTTTGLPPANPAQ